MKPLRGQSSFEFLLIFMGILAILTIGSIVSSGKIMEIQASQDSVEASKILEDAGGKINTAYIEGGGFSVKLRLPDKLLSTDYDISVNKNILRVDFKGSSYVKELITNETTGSFVKGVENTISNVGGVVKIN